MAAGHGPVSLNRFEPAPGQPEHAKTQCSPVVDTVKEEAAAAVASPEDLKSECDWLEESDGKPPDINNVSAVSCVDDVELAREEEEEEEERGLVEVKGEEESMDNICNVCLAITPELEHHIRWETKYGR